MTCAQVISIGNRERSFLFPKRPKLKEHPFFITRKFGERW